MALRDDIILERKLWMKVKLEERGERAINERGSNLIPRLVETIRGEVPLRRGKYGMDVEEYLEWVRERESNYKVRPPSDD